MKTNSFSNKLRIVDIILLIITGLNALAAGYSFIVDPTGKGLGINTDYLKYSPFNNFLIPGLILFLVLGAGSLIVTYLVIFKKSNYPIYILFHGYIISGWIIIQVLMLRMFHALHLIIFMIGIVLVISGFLLPRNEKTNA